MTVDGLANAVEEVDVSGLPIGPDNPYGNAIVQTVTRLTRESQAGRRADGSRGRTWRIVSTERSNRFGRPTSYTLYPESAPVLLADPASPLAKRAGFAANHLWVTRYDPAHRWPAGDFVNQNPGGAGLPAFIAGDQDIDGADIVLWHTFGPTHVPRPEDWPVMPVARCGFVLKPTGFFDRTPPWTCRPRPATAPAADLAAQRGAMFHRAGNSRLNAPSCRPDRWLRFGGAIRPAIRACEDLSDSCTEFGTINSGFGGRPYRYNYAATNEPGWFLFNGLVKHDTLTGREEQYQFEPGVFCSEVGVAPRVGGTEEDDTYSRDAHGRWRTVTCPSASCSAPTTWAAVRSRALQLPERIASGTHSCWAPGEPRVTRRA